MKGGSSQPSRLVTAIALVAVVVFAVPTVDAVFFSRGGMAGIAETGAGLQAEPILNAGNIDEVLESIEQAVVQDEGEAPDWFEAEVGLLPDARDIRVGNSGKVVGYVVDCDTEQARASLKEHMEELGWKCVSLGQVDGFTFIKSSGACTWALATCTQVASATSVVIRLQ